MTLACHTGVCTALGCGSNSSPETPQQDKADPSTNAACSDVVLSNESGQTVYASEIRGSGVSCAEAQQIARAWGRQNVGGPEAQLPQGWKCGAGGSCSRGKARVTWSLAYR